MVNVILGYVHVFYAPACHFPAWRIVAPPWLDIVLSGGRKFDMSCYKLVKVDGNQVSTNRIKSHMAVGTSNVT